MGSDNTPNLGLKRVNKIDHLNDYFNTDTLLDGNWDIIDANVARKAEVDAIRSRFDVLDSDPANPPIGYAWIVRS